ncbi:hypothetical protein F5890DRAFT_807532 [Lentinula detonsa]|uniref:Uncharacterized protein n=1 Tax=Lentinula detonsa TaxID=2804962 RepID=A0AA38PQN1_9AGAR|nr:hypothetical protein F5890DRAFT_807532 [Lentinula detonsa]
MRLTPAKAYVMLSLAMSIHALALPRSQNDVKEILVEARAYGVNPSAPPYPLPSISNSKPWPKVTPDSKDPNIYVVYSNIKERDHRLLTTSDTLVHDFLGRPRVQKILNLGSSCDPNFMRYPDSDEDRENLHFSIVGPSVCGVARRQCTVLLNRKSPKEKYWIKNVDGEIIAPNPWPVAVPQTPDSNLYVVYSSKKNRNDGSGEDVVRRFLRLPQTKAALNLDQLPEPRYVGYPDPFLDGEDIHFSIIGPEVCRGPDRRCTVSVNRKTPATKCWIKDADGNVFFRVRMHQP